MTLLDLVVHKYYLDSHFTREINKTTVRNFKDITHPGLLNKHDKIMDGSFDAVVIQRITIFEDHRNIVVIPAHCVGILFRFHMGNATFVPSLNNIPPTQDSKREDFVGKRNTMQLLNITLAVLILVYVNAETTQSSTTSKKAVKPSIPETPDRLRITEKLLPYVVKKYYDVTGGKNIDIGLIKNRVTIRDTWLYMRERFDATRVNYRNTYLWGWDCVGIEYMYAFDLLNYFRKQHPPRKLNENYIKGMITIVNKGSCKSRSPVFPKKTLLEMVAYKYFSDSHFTKEINKTTVRNFKDITHPGLLNKHDRILDGAFDAVVIQRITLFDDHRNVVAIPAHCVGIQFRFHIGNATFVPSLNDIPPTQDSNRIHVFRKGKCTLLGPNPLKSKN
ncbi:hypothetical protein WDU94_010708 [Cyamophila willieti]